MGNGFAASEFVSALIHLPHSRTPAPVYGPLPSNRNHLPPLLHLPAAFPGTPALSFPWESDNGCPYPPFQFPPAVLLMCIQSLHPAPRSNSHLRLHPLPAPVFSHFHTDIGSTNRIMWFSLRRLFLPLL